MKEYSLKYGDGKVSFALDEARVLGELHGKSAVPVQDIPAKLFAALGSPIQSAPLNELLAPADTVALVISDMSRFWMRQDLILPHLVDYLLAAGIAPQSLTIVVANGTHIGGSEEELKKLVTERVYGAIRVVNHDARANDLAYLGTTSFGTPVNVNKLVAEAGMVVCLGAPSHHVMAGFGGGRKSILPGVCGIDSIRHNHALSLHPTEPRSNPLIGNGVLAGNPVNEDMLEAAGMLKRLFVINLVMNADMQLSNIVAGDYRASWEAACAELDQMYEAPIPELADVIITGSGGFPKDMSLYQGTKTMDNVESGLKPGGTMVLCMECREGGGPREYFDWVGPFVDGSIIPKLRANFTIPGYVFFENCELAARYRIMLLSKIPPEQVAPMGIEGFNDIGELLSALELEGKSVYVIPNGSTVIPRVKK